MKIGIIIGSIRQGRISDRLALWVKSKADQRKELEVTMIDLKDYPLPLFDEAMSPQYNPDRRETGVVKSFLDIVDGQDSLIVVTPEYNRSYSSALKNAIDYVAFEMKRKPIMLVAHGSSGGAQAVAHLRGVFPGLLAVTSPAAVMVVGPLGQMLDEKGQSVDNPPGFGMPDEGLVRALDEFIWLSQTMLEGRSKESK